MPLPNISTRLPPSLLSHLCSHITLFKGAFLPRLPPFHHSFSLSCLTFLQSKCTNWHYIAYIFFICLLSVLFLSVLPYWKHYCLLTAVSVESRAVPAHNICWMCEFNPGSFLINTLVSVADSLKNTILKIFHDLKWMRWPRFVWSLKKNVNFYFPFLSESASLSLISFILLLRLLFIWAECSYSLTARPSSNLAPIQTVPQS